jgi:hypothetical protein
MKGMNEDTNQLSSNIFRAHKTHTSSVQYMHAQSPVTDGSIFFCFSISYFSGFGQV